MYKLKSVEPTTPPLPLCAPIDTLLSNVTLLPEWGVISIEADRTRKEALNNHYQAGSLSYRSRGGVGHPEGGDVAGRG